MVHLRTSAEGSSGAPAAPRTAPGTPPMPAGMVDDLVLIWSRDLSKSFVARVVEGVG